MKQFAIALACSALIGCAPATLSKLKESQSNVYEFRVAQNYQPVYRTVTDNARECWQTGLITAQMVVQSDLFTDIRKGQVAVALHGGLGVSTYLGIDIEAVSESESTVRVYAYNDPWAKNGQRVRKWLDGSGGKCS